MSEFAIILEVVGKAVSCVFNFTVDTICLALLVVSCVLPWRIIYIWKKLNANTPNFRSEKKNHSTQIFEIFYK